jgi:hypothetical protein
MRHFRLGLAAVLAAALWACERGGVPPDADLPPAAGDSAGAAPAETGVVVIPPFDPSLPALRVEAPEIRPQLEAARPERPVKRAAKPVTGASPPDAATHPPLEALFRAPDLPRPDLPATFDLAPPAQVRLVEPKPARAIDRLGQSIRLESHAEKIGPAGPRQGTFWETDAGVRIPVDESVALEGGVRVDSREEPGVKESERRSTPRVGVEVRF